MMLASWRVAASVAAVVLVTACDVGDPFRVLNEDRIVERVTVDPSTVTAAVRDTIRLKGTAIGPGDRVIAEAELEWSSGDPSIARSLGDGRFVVVSVGTAELFATTRGRRGSADLIAR